MADLNELGGAQRVATTGIADGPGSAYKGRAHEKRDLDWLLVQNQPLAGVPEEDLILAEVPEFAPESVDDDIARDHGLQLVRRLTLGASSRRIVAYRVFDRSPAEVIAALRRDRRVSSAQMNMVYRLPETAPVPGAISDAKSPFGILGKQTKRQGSRHDQKGSGSTSGPRPTAGKLVTALPSLGASQALVTKEHGRPRWPTADEPFLDMGTTEK